MLFGNTIFITEVVSQDFAVQIGEIVPRADYVAVAVRLKKRIRELEPLNNRLKGLRCFAVRLVYQIIELQNVVMGARYRGIRARNRAGRLFKELILASRAGERLLPAPIFRLFGRRTAFGEETANHLVVLEVGFYYLEHVDGMLPDAAADEDTHIREANDPLQAIADVHGGLEVVPRVEVEPLLAVVLLSQGASRVFRYEVPLTDRPVEGFFPLVLRRGIENLAELPQIGLQDGAPGEEGLLAKTGSL